MITKSSTTLNTALRTALTTFVLLAAAGTVSAAPVGELYPADQQGQAVPAAAPVKTRAQVIDELVQARAAGQVASGELGYAFGTPAERNAVRGKSRAEVIAEYRQAAGDGTLVAQGEGESTPTRFAGSARSRADVRADAIQSAHSSIAAGNTGRGN